MHGILCGSTHIGTRGGRTTMPAANIGLLASSCDWLSQQAKVPAPIDGLPILAHSSVQCP